MNGQYATSRRTKSEVVALGERIAEPGADPRTNKNNRQVRPQPEKLGDVFSRGLGPATGGETMTSQIECPLCSGSGASGDHQCPECRGTGSVVNVFADLRHGRYETDEETAEAECRPLAEVQAERRAITCPACKKLNPLAHEDGAVDGPREYHAECWARLSDAAQQAAWDAAENTD